MTIFTNKFISSVSRWKNERIRSKYQIRSNKPLSCEYIYIHRSMNFERKKLRFQRTKNRDSKSFFLKEKEGRIRFLETLNNIGEKIIRKAVESRARRGTIVQGRSRLAFSFIIEGACSLLLLFKITHSIAPFTILTNRSLIN